MPNSREAVCPASSTGFGLKTYFDQTMEIVESIIEFSDRVVIAAD